MIIFWSFYEPKWPKSGEIFDLATLYTKDQRYGAEWRRLTYPSVVCWIFHTQNFRFLSFKPLKGSDPKTIMIAGLRTIYGFEEQKNQ